MSRFTLLALVLSAGCFGILTLPARADWDHHGWGGHDHGSITIVTHEVVQPSVRVITRTVDEQDDIRVYQQWYNWQVRGYDEVDTVSGELFSNLAHMITDVGTDCITVTNSLGARQTVMLTNRTALLFQPCQAFRKRMGDRMHSCPEPGPITAARLHPGDMVILEGVLRASGNFAASKVRMIGHAWGWDGDDDLAAPQGYGFRGWGAVNTLDVDRKRVEIDSNGATRSLLLAPDAEVIVRGHVESLNYLRHGDHVVFYYRRADLVPTEVYRIVLITDGQDYPNANGAYWADPTAYQTTSTVTTVEETTVVEGEVEYITTGVTFNRLRLRDHGNVFEIRVGGGGFAYGHHGERIPLAKLHDRDHLRVRYYKVGGVMFAGRIELP